MDSEAVTTKEFNVIAELKRRQEVLVTYDFERNLRLLYPKKCLQCDRTFKSESGLTRHLNTMHLILSPNQLKQKETWARKHE